MRLELRARWQVSPAQNLALSPDGRRLASAHVRSNEIKVWDTTTGHLIDQWANYPHQIFALAFSLDGEHLAYAGGGGNVTVRTLAAGSEQHRVIEDGPFLITNLMYSPDSRLLAGTTVSGGLRDTNDIIVWNVARGKRTAKLDGHARNAHCLAFNCDGKRLAVGTHGGFKIWTAGQRGRWQAESFPDPEELKIKTGRRLGLPLMDAVTSLVFSADDTELILLVRHSELHRWNVALRRTVGKPCSKSGKVVNAVGLLPHGGDVITFGFQLSQGRLRGEVCVWDSKRGNLLCEVAGGTGEQRTFLRGCVSADGRTIAAMEHTRVWVWEVVE